MAREYTTDITELKMESFFKLQKGFMILTLGDSYLDINEVIGKALSLIKQGKPKEAHRVLVSLYTIGENIKNEESSVMDALNVVLKIGELEKATYKEIIQELQEVKKKSSKNN